MANTRTQWYTEEAGFFGAGYLKEYASMLTAERTRDEVAGIVKLLRLRKGMKVLDLACGHGRHTVPLAARGLAMTGQDLNRFFLRTAARAAKKAGVRVRFEQGDMREIPFEDEFDVVLNLFTAFGYLESDLEDQRVLAAVARALKPGGRFMIDFMNHARLMRIFQARNWTQLKDGSTVITERAYDFVRGRIDETRTRIRKDGRRDVFAVPLRVYTLAELVAMCVHVGLSYVASYGSYSGDPLDTTTQRCILITQKRKE